jgi:hypothetical protein
VSLSGTLTGASRRVRGAFTVLISKTPALQTGLTFGIFQYQRTGDPAVLADVLATLRFAAGTTNGSRGQARMLCMNNLGQALRLEYERTGDQDAQARAVSQLTARQQLVLNHSPQLLTDPVKIFHALGLPRGESASTPGEPR